MSKATLNRKTYLKAPEVQQTLDFISELGVTMAQFERFYGIAVGTLRQVKCGNAELPAKHWHIVYEKIKPMYGAAYYARKKEPKANKSGVATPKQEFPHGNKLLDQLKDKLK